MTRVERLKYFIKGTRQLWRYLNNNRSVVMVPLILHISDDQVTEVCDYARFITGESFKWLNNRRALKKRDEERQSCITKEVPTVPTEGGDNADKK